MNFTTKSLLFICAAVGLSSAQGCVSDRPARTGVFNENQYLRKGWLIRPGDAGPDGKPQPDNGWMLKSTVTEVSSPNSLGGDMFGVFAGAHNFSDQVRFAVTSDKLQMVSMREFSPNASVGRTASVVNTWPVTNVDLKYRVNLDGETTNFYEENQENDWAVRQFVKVNLDKNDLSDVAPLGPFLQDSLNKCADVGNVSATLVPGSFVAWDHSDGADYMQWAVNITVPLNWSDATCVEAYGEDGILAAKIGRYDVSFTLKYSLTRAKSDADAVKDYQPLAVEEKDSIRHKYGPISYTAFNRDETTGLVAANQYVIRFNPNKPIVWYFEKGFPEAYKQFYLGAGGIKDQTNALLQKSNAKAVLDFRNSDDERDLPGDLAHPDGGGPAKAREFGDVRFNFLRWVSDKQLNNGAFAGVTQFNIDPRTGETLTSDIVLEDFEINDYYTQRIDAFLKSVGASADVNTPGEWPDLGKCKDGDTIPILPDTETSVRNASSSLFGKIQQYLQKPIATYGNLAPNDFTASQDDDFFASYFPLIQFNVFGDPDANPFVIREGGAGVYGPAEMWKKVEAEAEFHKRAATIDHGQEPFQDSTGPNGLKNAVDFANRMRELTINHRDLQLSLPAVAPYRFKDTTDAFSFETVIARDARHCINGKWETKAQWVANLISTYWSQVAWHEFGHALGLEHNFMSSVDKPNFPTPTKDAKGKLHYGLYSSSVMEYNSAPDRIFWTPGWAPYDQGAIAWIYANSTKTGASSPTALSGQNNPTSPWLDPAGFTPDGKERQFLRCDDYQIRYTPLCRQGDLGVTPSEIIANQITSYEWGYQWRNFRTYHKFWDNSRYADSPAALTYDMKRFISQWAFDWNEAEIAGTVHRLGINPPQGIPAANYYAQLTHKFTIEMSAANSLVAAFHKAIIQESAGERPFATVYDKFYGDELQQGIILDKYFAMQSWVGLWPTDNYDQNQAGSYISSYSDFGEPFFRTVSEDAVTSMVGTQYDVYTYFIPTAVGLFAQDTHSPAFTGAIQDRDWIGGLTFYRVQDFQAYFKNIEVQAGKCTSVDACAYDVTNRLVSKADSWNEFVASDGKTYIWSFVPDRNVYVLARKDRNIATYKILHQYNDDVLVQLDDGTFGTYGYQLPIKYTLDSFTQFN
jgi:hypothetical protein